MMAMPICASMVVDKLLVNTKGEATRISANRLQMTHRPTLQGLNLYTAAMASSLASTQQTLGPEDQGQHQKQVGQDGRNLRQCELGE